MIVAAVAHARNPNYWSACLQSGIVFAATYFAWLTAVQLIFPSQTESTLLLIGWYAVVAFIGGILETIVAAIVGVPFVLDRRIEQRERARGDWG